MASLVAGQIGDNKGGGESRAGQEDEHSSIEEHEDAGCDEEAACMVVLARILADDDVCRMRPEA